MKIPVYDLFENLRIGLYIASSHLKEKLEFCFVNFDVQEFLCNLSLSRFYFKSFKCQRGLGSFKES